LYVLVIAFFVTEISVVHLQLRRDAHSFSLSEVPIVLGLFFASPTELLLAQLAGSFFALVFFRRQPWLKATFNLAQFGLQTGISIAVFHQLLGSNMDPIGWAGWSAAFVSMLVASVASVALINLAMYLSGEPLGLRSWTDTLGMATTVTLANTSLALVGTELLWIQWQSVWLLVLPVGVVLVAYRAFTSQRQKHHSLESLYESSRQLQQSLEVERAVLSLLSRAREMFRAEIASMTFVPETEGEPASRTVLGPGPKVVTSEAVELDPTEGVWARAVAEGTGVLVRRPIANPKLRAYFESQGIKDAMVASLHLEDRVLGTMLVGNRLGDVSTFDDEDLKLLETLANHAAVSLENARLVGRLEESLAHLTEMNRLKDDFVASVSHELRTPLTSILGYVKTLRRPNVNFSESDKADFLQAIERQSERLRDLIEDLLIVSRIESARDSAVVEPIDIPRLIEDVFAELSEPSEGRVITIDLESGLPALATDRGKLHQIVSNIVGNALKYSPNGSEITLALSKEGRGINISVIDNGDGIPPELHERIFDRFYQVDQSSTRERGGTGLGLYICRRLAEMIGGRLWLERSDETGSTFSLWVPAGPPHSTADISAVEGVEPPQV
jgi:signal transduction histidine kinase